jgi:membrane-associated phospholipid phosphatase
VSSAIDDRPAALPAPLRRPAAVLALAAALGVVALGLHYAGDTSASRVDGWLEDVVTAVVPGPGLAIWIVGTLGDPLPVVVAAGLLAALCLGLDRRRLAVLAVVGPGLTGLATATLKPVFGRTITGGLAFPSGHTAALTALAVVVALIVASLVGAGALSGLLLIVAAAMAAGTAMGIALVVMDVHYPTDTVGGFGTGIAVVLGTALLIDRIADRSGVSR